jgi:phosphatidylglycerophosphate synthase
MSLRETAIARSYYRIIEAMLLKPLMRIFSHPNQFTLLGLAVAALAPLGFLWHAAAGICAILISAVVDSLDGLMARKTNQGSLFGAFLDSSLDRVSDFFYLAGFWLMFRQLPHFTWASLLAMFAVLCTVLVSYTKARAEGLGGTCQVGLMGRAQRVIYLLIWGTVLVLFPAAHGQILWWGLALYAALTAFTVVQRILHVRSHGLPG